MKILPAALAFFLVSAWAWSATADCFSRSVCDDSGDCRLVEQCDDGISGVQHAAADMTPIPSEAEARMSIPAASEGAGDIRGRRRQLQAGRHLRHLENGLLLDVAASPRAYT